MKTLVSFSGGLDSTYIMWKLLRETNDEITAVFFDQRYNLINAHHGETSLAPFLEVTSTRVAEWLKTNIREFTFIKVPIYEFLDDEVLTVYFARYGANLVKHKQFDRIVSGQVGFGDACLNEIGLTTRVIAAERAFKNITQDGKFWTPLFDWNKRTPHQLAELPKKLASLTLSCQNPIVNKYDILPCGNCEKCDRNTFFSELLESGVSPDDTILKWKETEYSKKFQKRIVRLFASYRFDRFDIWKLS
jgi:7-cyano-7-deazaguanine synthase in queuosine biosynthesis